MRPIPSRILTHTVTFKICAGVDTWNHPVFANVQVDHVCVQPYQSTTLTRDDTDRRESAICFIDAVRSTHFDADAGKIQSEDNGHVMQMIFRNNTYEVLLVDTLYDDKGLLHHYEVHCGERGI